MVDPQPAPIVSESPNKDLLALREAEILKVAESGQERMEKEQALQDNLEQHRLAEEKKARKAMSDAEAATEGKHVHAKKFRTKRIATEREILEEKERQKKLEERQVERKRQHDDEVKKQDSYLHLLREAAGLKIAKEHHENELKREAETAKKKAGTDLSAALEAAVETERLAQQGIEQEVRARKSLIDIDTRSVLYKWEAEQRMKMHEIESETHRKLADIQQEEHSAFEQQRKKASVALFMSAKKRHVDVEMEGKKQAIEFEDRRKRATIDTEAQGRRVDAARERQHAIHRAEQKYSDRLNEIGREYLTKHYDHKR